MDCELIIKNTYSCRRKSPTKWSTLFHHSTNKPTADIIAKVETAIITLLDREEVEIIRAKTSLIRQKAKPPTKNLPAEQKKALHSLREDKSITILPADKGQSTVILKKQDYINKCQYHLNNGPYTKIQKIQQNQLRKKPDKNYLS